MTPANSRAPGVMHLIYSLTAGGAETLTAQLADRAGALGFRPKVCAWRAGGPVAERLDRCGVPVALLDLRRRRGWRGWKAWDLARAVYAVCREARKHDAAIVHAHLHDGATLGVLAVRLTRMLGWRCHLVFTHHSISEAPPDLIRGSLHWRLRRWLFAWSLRRADRIIAISDAVVSTLAGVGAPLDRVRLVVNGVHLPPPTTSRDRAAIRCELGVAPDVPMAICIGRLDPAKGQDRLIAAWAHVRALVPGAVLVLVGDGSCRATIAAAAASQGSQAVLVLGARQDVPDLLAASDAFVTASAFEGLSLALLEALARGLPCMSIACPGNTEVLADGDGLLIPPAGEAALKDGLVRILGDRVLRDDLRSRGPRLIAQRYAFDRTVEQTYAVYRELLIKDSA